MKQLLVLPEKCTGCRRCEAECQRAHGAATGVSGSPRLEVVRIRGRFYPSVCRHCVDAPCADACMSGALRRDGRTGMVRLDSGRCRGCWMCLMACPFGVIRADHARGLAHKCDGCPERELPACVEACEPGALVFSGTADFEKARRRARVRPAPREVR